MKTDNASKTFTVHVTYTMVHEVEVEAKDAEEAVRKAKECWADEDQSCDDFDRVVEVCVTDER